MTTMEVISTASEGTSVSPTPPLTHLLSSAAQMTSGSGSNLSSSAPTGTIQTQSQLTAIVGNLTTSTLNTVSSGVTGSLLSNTSTTLMNLTSLTSISSLTNATSAPSMAPPSSTPSASLGVSDKSKRRSISFPRRVMSHLTGSRCICTRQ